MTQDDYKVQLEVFEGPLDLLLYLIKRDEIDIYNIPIERITSQYMEYLSLMRMLDLNIAGEFIVMAATLMMIKSRMLLPVDERPEAEEEDEDPRWDLVRQLVEYKRFKDAAAFLQACEIRQEDVFAGGADGIVVEPDAPGAVLQDIGLFDLMAAFSRALKNAREETIGEIAAERFTVADKMDAILTLVRSSGETPFARLFGPRATRQEIVSTFLALLELLRLRQVRVRQGAHFGTILVRRCNGSPDGERPPEAACGEESGADMRAVEHG